MMLAARRRLVSFVGLLSLGLSGCAIATSHLNISQWPVTTYAMYYRDPAPYRLAVLPLVDQRPGQEREGQRPRGMFLLLWNRRVGDYYTGDQIFGGNVAAQLSQQLSAYLTSTHAFAEVIPIPASSAPQGSSISPADILALRQAHMVDYVLQGQVQHFFGSQTQHTSIYLLPLYFVSTMGWQDSKTLPWGRTAIQYTLYDGRSGDIAWRQLLEADRTLPRQTDAMSEAALQSFVDVAGQMASNLRTAAVEPKETP